MFIEGEVACISLFYLPSDQVRNGGNVHVFCLMCASVACCDMCSIFVVVKYSLFIISMWTGCKRVKWVCGEWSGCVEREDLQLIVIYDWSAIVYDPLMLSEETILHCFLSILKQLIQIVMKIIKKCISVVSILFQSTHRSVLPMLGVLIFINVPVLNIEFNENKVESRITTSTMWSTIYLLDILSVSSSR